MAGSLRPALATPLTETVTVSREPAPLGPSIREVDSVRMSPVRGGRSEEEEVVWGGEVGSRSQGMRVRAAPLKSSCGEVEDRKADEEVVRVSLFGEEEVAGMVVRVGRGYSFAVLETEMTRSRARR